MAGLLKMRAGIWLAAPARPTADLRLAHFDVGFLAAIGCRRLGALV